MESTPLQKATSTESTELSVGIHTLGCRLNQYESDGILNRFGRHSYRIVPLTDGPDIAIINTCTVTESADARNRNIIRQVLRRNPQARIFVTGCYAQTDPEKILGIPGVRAVVGNDRKSNIFEIIEGMLEEERRSDADPVSQSVHSLRTTQSPPSAQVSLSGGAIADPGRGKRAVLTDPFAYGDVFPVDHSRAYLKIQDGCDRKCSYCKIPQARGGGISRDAAEIMAHLRRMDEAGIPEIVLTGVNLGWFRENNMRFADLLERMLETVKHARIRLSSIEPSDVNERLAELSLHPRFCNYLHVPVQSGSANILRQMKRSYTPETFRMRIEKVRSINPDVFLGTDLMVGFPGETDADFEDSMKLLVDLDIAGVHAFPFSPREGTAAAVMPGRVHGTIVKERMQRVAAHKEAAMESFYRRMDGRIVEGVLEGEIKAEAKEAGSSLFMEALTGEFLRLNVPVSESSPLRRGQLVKLRLQAEGRVGVLV
ncbi:MAG: tRNA (N(6)-L-threonylcarbamoyladenosine(37)-C(2))-methylthiotransferase MtaB [Leptonema illini]|uniref:tRNA (N(6)-L-threonylcarbamoyladenosine(37)-C(2))-methylthiotransferase MtaB n=1 Tax=Leptonema illini TaxID=183 RepID=A0A833LWJ2_9LEPT|nr:MAG: tRNA (N(6)-L-threonylcarbamoyladenosine(37)-C(2))-methylthiotransferase MtaB [Leptonema illini]